MSIIAWILLGLIAVIGALAFAGVLVWMCWPGAMPKPQNKTETLRRKGLI